jgi:hypothetical protein
MKKACPFFPVRVNGGTAVEAVLSGSVVQKVGNDMDKIRKTT